MNGNGLNEIGHGGYEMYEMTLIGGSCCNAENRRTNRAVKRLGQPQRAAWIASPRPFNPSCINPASGTPGCVTYAGVGYPANMLKSGFKYMGPRFSISL